MKRLYSELNDRGFKPHVWLSAEPDGVPSLAISQVPLISGLFPGITQHVQSARCAHDDVDVHRNELPKIKIQRTWGPEEISSIKR